MSLAASTSMASLAPRLEGGGRESSAGLRVRLLTSAAELREHAGQWERLLGECEGRSIFMTPQWHCCWLDTVARDAEVLVLLVEDAAGRLCGIAPFYESRYRLCGALGFRILRVIGDRDAGADYPDLLVRRGTEGAVLEAVRGALLSSGVKWDCIWLPNVSGWSGAAERWETVASEGLLLHQRPADFASIPLPESHETYFRGLSSHTRSTLRRQSERLAAAGHEVRRCESLGELDAMLSELFCLHDRRWRAVGQVGAFERSPRMRDFYRWFAPVALRKGWLRLFSLRIGGRTVAVQYGYAYEGKFYQVQEGFDPNGPVGTGNVLRHHVLRACIEEGLREYDILGTFTEHKRRWGARRRLGFDFLLGRESLKTRLLFARPIWPTGRYLTPVTSRSAA